LKPTICCEQVFNLDHIPLNVVHLTGNLCISSGEQTTIFNLKSKQIKGFKINSDKGVTMIQERMGNLKLILIANKNEFSFLEIEGLSEAEKTDLKKI